MVNATIFIQSTPIQIFALLLLSLLARRLAERGVFMESKEKAIFIATFHLLEKALRKLMLSHPIEYCAIRDDENMRFSFVIDYSNDNKGGG